MFQNTLLKSHYRFNCSIFDFVFLVSDLSLLFLICVDYSSMAACKGLSRTWYMLFFSNTTYFYSKKKNMIIKKKDMIIFCKKNFLKCLTKRSSSMMSGASGFRTFDKLSICHTKHDVIGPKSSDHFLEMFIGQ